MLSRRALVGKLAAGAASAAVAWAAGVKRAGAASPRREAHTPLGSAPGEGAVPVPDVPEVKVPVPGVGVAVVDAGSPLTLSALPPWELVRPLALGSMVAHGWRVAELTGVVDGTCVLTLRHTQGRTHRIHLCRNDGRPHGLVYTPGLDLVVMNGGQGDLPTDEGLAQAVAEVAHVLAANEGGRPHEVAALLPHAERLRRYAAAAGARLR